ncbi:nucleotidyltransferase family protein [Pleomorphovibrio marinus]|uniref:nucleotidyltransferase family protein n=1 Tax=Pleomorphovibrio marinus TaxID=2164132 RepID=UPI000E0AF3EE|nr:nucleotidyltransferase family protein [Pleomorphovibrio marinus]
MSNSSTAILILAGGSSSRLGYPKQTLPYKGDFLLNHAIHAAMGVSASQCRLVLGAYAKEIQKIIPKIDSMEVLQCKNWEEGMGASIRCGMKDLPRTIDQVIIMLGDQPFVNTSLLKTLVDLRKETDKNLVACKYGDGVGVPALFGKKYFPLLNKLQGSGGAKKILMNQQQDLLTHYFPMGIVDVDKESDYQALLKEDWEYFRTKNTGLPKC